MQFAVDLSRLIAWFHGQMHSDEDDLPFEPDFLLAQLSRLANANYFPPWPIKTALSECYERQAAMLGIPRKSLGTLR